MTKRVIIGLLLVGMIVITDSQIVNAAWWDNLGKSDSQKKSQASEKGKALAKDTKQQSKQVAQQKGVAKGQDKRNVGGGGGGGNVGTGIVSRAPQVERTVFGPARAPRATASTGAPSLTRAPQVQRVSTSPNRSPNAVAAPQRPSTGNSTITSAPSNANPNVGVPRPSQIPGRQT